MCGNPRYMAKIDNRMKYYKRINRYTLFQITFVYMPTIAASVYNLWYTWYGRQIFWIDIESISMGITMSVLHVVIMIRSQKEYIKQVFEVGEFDKHAHLSSRSREKYLVDNLSKDLANEIAQKGFQGDRYKQRISEMSTQQRVGTLRAIFDRIFAKKQIKVEGQGFRLKHGRGLDINHDLFAEDDLDGARAYEAAGAAVSRGYRSEMPASKSKKMLYSSVTDEERRRAGEIKDERNQLEFQQLGGHDVTNTMPDGAELGATQPIDTLVNDTTPRDLSGRLIKTTGRGGQYEAVKGDATQPDLTIANAAIDDGTYDPLKMMNGGSTEMQTLRAKKNSLDSAKFDNVLRGKQRDGDRLEVDSDIAGGVDKEIYNFSSAPQNAKSALAGNKGLEERYNAF